MRKRLILGAAALTAGMAAAYPGHAKVTGFEIVQRISPAFEGTSFGEAGAYERIDAIVRLAIDPESPRGRAIVDLDKAPRNADGLVEYETEVTILRPVEAGGGNGAIFYDVPNRGRNLAFMLMNLSGGSGIPEIAADAGDGFLMRQGYTIVWSGWQFDLPEASISIALPVAAGVTGQTREEFVFDKTDPVITSSLTYPAANTAPSAATLTVRQRAEDPRSTAPGLGFRYIGETEIEITRPEDLDAGAIYEFTYPATGARPTGLAFAATSDVVSFLRGSAGHDAASPLSGIDRTIALGISQSGRFLRDLIHHGFNADENGARVFDGAIPHIAGSRKSFTNFRFAQAGRYSRQHEDHDYPGDQFPFTYAEVDDPLSGLSGSILTACAENATCPKIMHTDTSTEFWQARAALLTTSPTGEPLTMPENVRLYFIAGAPHFSGWSASSGETPTCRFPSNPLSAGPALRALLTGMDAWIAEEVDPPTSRYPSLADGTLVPLGALRLPEIAEGSYVPVYNELQVRDHAASPPTAGATYPILVPRLDANGNPVGGVALPPVAEALGTFWGWNLRKAGFAEGDLCGLTGTFLAAPDLAKRHKDTDAYAGAVRAAAEALAAERLVLPEDVDLLAERARADYEAAIAAP